VLHELLPRADWLLLSCPLTEDTRGLVDETALALLPSHAHVLNVSRGAVIDERALIRALEQRQIAGAYLDVFEQEPLPADSPLWDMPGVLMTPHNSAVSSGNDDRVVEIFLDNLGLWHAGQPLINHVTTIE
jgi:phosphoglycerate dehydrogenase-like enzyme